MTFTDDEISYFISDEMDIVAVEGGQVGVRECDPLNKWIFRKGSISITHLFSDDSSMVPRDMPRLLSIYLLIKLSNLHSILTL